MSKAKMYGKNTGYIPNAKRGMRHRKKVYQRGREKSFRDRIFGTRKEKDSAREDMRHPCETCVRWSECNGVDDKCPRR